MPLAPLGTEPEECGSCPLAVLIFLGGNGSVFVTIFKLKRKQTRSLDNEGEAVMGGVFFPACAPWGQVEVLAQAELSLKQSPNVDDELCVQCFGVCWRFQLKCCRGLEAHFMCSSPVDYWERRV